MQTDAFSHHPELRDLIIDPARSRFRQFSIEHIEKLMIDHGLEGGWWYSDETREAMRAQFLSNLPSGDLWVFAYGSLMSDPGIKFTDVRRAVLPGHARRFILIDTKGGRGTPEAPGLMAALDVDDGGHCDGLAFRIAEKDIAAETKILWQREMVTSGYHAVLAPMQIGGESVTALTFVADHSAEMIQAEITRAEQVQLLATGSGFFGSSLDYLENIERQFSALGIADPEISSLLSVVRDQLGKAKA